MVFKKCFVRNCTNNSRNTGKIFIHVPNNHKVREKWFVAVEKPFTKTGNLYCCEDHFNLVEDAENFYRAVYQGAPVKLRENVVPHLLLEYPDTQKATQLIPLDELNITAINKSGEDVLQYSLITLEPEQIIGIAPKIQ